MKKAALISVALVFASSPLLLPSVAMSQGAQGPTDRPPQAAEKGPDPDTRGDRSGTFMANPELRNQVGRALEAVEDACSMDISAYCGRVTPGEGRLALCMRAHEDQLSRGCTIALRLVARGLERTVDRVAETCLNEVRSLCGDGERIGQCVAQKKASLSPACESIVNTIGQKMEGLMARIGMPVFSAENKNLGQIAEVVRGPDGKVQSIRVDVGQMLGLGPKVVTINAEKMEQIANGIRLRISEQELRSMPDTKKPQQ